MILQSTAIIIQIDLKHRKLSKTFLLKTGFLRTYCLLNTTINESNMIIIGILIAFNKANYG